MLASAAGTTGTKGLTLTKAAQEILKRPRGFLEFYVSCCPIHNLGSNLLVLYLTSGVRAFVSSLTKTEIIYVKYS